MGLKGDIRSALRSLTTNRIVSAVGISSLALGIGANIAIFALVNGLLLRKLPVVEPDRLVTVASDFAISRGYKGGAGWSYAMWQRLQPHIGLFDGALAWSGRPFTIGRGARTDVARGLYVSGGFFTTLGVKAEYGRVLRPDDDVVGGGNAGPVAVVSHAFAQRWFGATPGIVGTTLVVDGVTFTIVGVTPPGFQGIEVGESFDVALPIGSESLSRSKNALILGRGSYLLLVMLRLKPSQSLPSANAMMKNLEPEIVPADAPQFVRPFALAPAAEGTSSPSGGAGGLRQRFQQPLLIMMAIAGFVLLIGCLNLAHLSLARAAARRREFSVRVALGASRWQIAQLLLIENLVLAGAAAVVGIVFAGWASRALVAQMSTSLRSVALNLSMDARLAAFAIVLTFATAFVFGIGPVVQTTRLAAMDALKSHSQRTTSDSTGRFSGWLVVTQVALSLVLLVAAGLLVRTFHALTTRPLGFDTAHVLVVRVDTVRARVNAASKLAFFEQLADAASRAPGVERAAASMWTPLTGGGAMLGVSVAPGNVERGVIANFVTPGWFAAYGTPLVQGRDVDLRDNAGALPVLVVNQAFVRRFIPGGNVLGAQVNMSTRIAEGPPARTIVGVAGDAVFRSDRTVPGITSRALRDEIPPMIFMPLMQSAGMGPMDSAVVHISVRANGPPESVAPVIATALAGVDPDLGLTMRPLSDYLEASIAEERMNAMLAGFFGVVGLLLAGLGVYGVTSYSVHTRRTELGIRLALGSRPRGILWLVFVRVTVLVALGVIVGGVASLWASRTLGALLFGLDAHDPTTFTAAAIALALVGAFAGWLPALRACRTDPAIVLRGE